MLILKTIASLLENSYKNENKNKLKYEEYWCKNKTKHRISSLILINNISTKPFFHQTHYKTNHYIIQYIKLFFLPYAYYK